MSDYQKKSIQELSLPELQEIKTNLQERIVSINNFIKELELVEKELECRRL